LSDDERRALIEADTDNRSKYNKALDRESAHERLQARNSLVWQVKAGVRKFSDLLRSGH
jgi:hypothetical protein